jgi:Spy/CpxP family protein refolding chaperone
MKRQLTLLAAIGALAAGTMFAQTATAPPAPAKTPKVRALVRKRLMKNLDLTAAQKQQAKSIFQSAKQTSQPVAQQLKDDRQALTAAVQSGDSAKIQQLSQEMGTLRGKMVAARSDAMSKFWATLSPDQKTKAQQFLQKAKDVLGRKNG